MSASGPMADRLYTTAQVADRLQLPVTTVRGAIRDGRLRAFLPAGRRHGYRIAESSIQAWLHASEYRRPSERRAMRSRRWAIALAAGVLALPGCGGGSPSEPAAPAVDGAPSGRPIGGADDPRQQAAATAVRFVRGYLAFQAGRLGPERVPDASAQLRRALRHQRIPPAQRDRRAEVVRAEVNRIDARSARVTVTVRNRDEALTYPLPIDLVRRQGSWLVLAAGDDT